MAGRTLEVFRDGRRSTPIRSEQLPPGAKGNRRTLEIMAQIVREDSTQNDLKVFVFREIIGLDKRTLEAQIQRAFDYAQKEIRYLPEKEGFETLADIWSSRYSLNALYPVGDCAIKCIALATCLVFCGLKPVFTAIGQVPNADYYNHVFVTVFANGRRVAFDPTPENFRIGDELNSLRALDYPIFV